jgi:VWFA-related protein
MHARAVVLLLLGLASNVALTGQQPASPDPLQDLPPITFRVEVNYVEVDAIVVDADGNPVRDLTAADFEILEDGVPQEVSAFSLVDLPVERDIRPLFASAPVELDVQANSRAEGRIYLFVLDDLHTDPMRAVSVKTAARQFIERHFAANDLGAVTYTSGRQGDGQDFTGSRALLLAAIDRFTGNRDRGDTGGFDISIDRVVRDGNARVAMRSIARLADFMAGVRGRRKAMLWFSEGIAYDFFDTAGATGGAAAVRGSSELEVITAAQIASSAGSEILDQTRAAIGAATRGNVAVYAIDPRGLTGPNDLNVNTTATGNIFGGPLEPGGVGPRNRELQLGQDSLRAMAASTGGFAAVNRTDFTGAFERIVTENSTYYVMGYYSSNGRREGRFRRIEVRVTRPGLTVRSRQGYIEPRGRAAATVSIAGADRIPAPVREAIASPLPMSGLPLRVSAVPLIGTGRNATIAVAAEVETTLVRFDEQNGQLTGRIYVSYALTDDDGRVRAADTQAANLRFPPEALAAARMAGFRFLTQAEVPPGRYQLRVAASGEEGPSGSVIFDLTVPDFRRERFSMSGVIIGADSASTRPTSRPRDPFAQLLAVPPVTTRTFDRTDILSIFAEFYENMPDVPSHNVEIATTLSAEGGRVVYEDFATRNSSELRGSSGGYGYRTDIPLAGYEPGLYVLRVEGRARIGQLPPVFREVPINIR